jgi:hypothetical protein
MHLYQSFEDLIQLSDKLHKIVLLVDAVYHIKKLYNWITFM